jgi:phage protein D
MHDLFLGGLVDGERAPQAVEQLGALLTGGLLELRIDETADGLHACEATFGNWGPRDGATGFLYFDRQLLEFGKPFEVRIGTEPIFRGLVTALGGRYPDGDAPRIAVLAEDRLQDLRMTRRTRTFADVSDGDVFQAIAGDHGLSPDVSVSGPQHEVLAQLDQSDLAFLRERARAIDAELWVEDRTLKARPRATRNGGAVTLGYGNELRELTVSADLAHQRTSVRVGGWDVAGKSALQFDATDSTVSGELKGGESGAGVLSSALGERKEALAHSVPVTSQEAQARAESLFRRRARRFVSGRGVAETTAKLRVGAYVTLEGLGPLFAGEFYVTWVRHLFDGSAGLRTELGVERPGLGRA